MPKRLNDNEDSGSESLSLDLRLSPNKRSKTENTGDSEPTVVDSSSLSDAPDEESEEEDSVECAIVLYYLLSFLRSLPTVQPGSGRGVLL